MQTCSIIVPDAESITESGKQYYLSRLESVLDHPNAPMSHVNGHAILFTDGVHDIRILPLINRESVRQWLWEPFLDGEALDSNKHKVRTIVQMEDSYGRIVLAFEPYADSGMYTAVDNGSGTHTNCCYYWVREGWDTSLF